MHASFVGPRPRPFALTTRRKRRRASATLAAEECETYWCGSPLRPVIWAVEQAARFRLRKAEYGKVRDAANLGCHLVFVPGTPTSTALPVRSTHPII